MIHPFMSSSTRIIRRIAGKIGRLLRLRMYWHRQLELPPVFWILMWRIFANIPPVISCEWYSERRLFTALVKRWYTVTPITIWRPELSPRFPGKNYRTFCLKICLIHCAFKGPAGQRARGAMRWAQQDYLSELRSMSAFWCTLFKRRNVGRTPVAFRGLGCQSYGKPGWPGIRFKLWLQFLAVRGRKQRLPLRGDVWSGYLCRPESIDAHLPGRLMSPR